MCFLHLHPQWKRFHHMANGSPCDHWLVFQSCILAEHTLPFDSGNKISNVHILGQNSASWAENKNKEINLSFHQKTNYSVTKLREAYRLGYLQTACNLIVVTQEDEGLDVPVPTADVRPLPLNLQKQTNKRTTTTKKTQHTWNIFQFTSLFC